MPDGHVQRVDEGAGVVTIVRRGRPFVADLGEVASEARVPGARVHFDKDQHAGPDTVRNVRLLSGTRTNKRQRRFGDLNGAKRPGAKVKSTAASRLGVDVTTQSGRVAAAWLEAMAETAFDDATSLYAPNAALHTEEASHVGRRAIRAALEDVVADGVGRTGDDATVQTFDQLVCICTPDDDTDLWMEIHRGAIVEQWYGLAPEWLGGDDDPDALSIIRSGALGEADEARLRAKLEPIVERLPATVDEIRVKIDEPSAPSQPISMSVSVHAGEYHVRSHVRADTLTEAVDAACLRLRTQVSRAVERERQSHRRAADDSWSGRLDRRAHQLSSATMLEPEIVRHKTRGSSPASIDAALWDMDQADYDFFLFVEEGGGDLGLVWRDDDGAHAQLLGGGTPEKTSPFAEMVTAPAPTLTVSDAAAAMAGGEKPFVFARTPDGGAFVLYRRFDGQLGVIEPG